MGPIIEIKANVTSSLLIGLSATDDFSSNRLTPINGRLLRTVRLAIVPLFCGYVEDRIHCYYLNVGLSGINEKCLSSHQYSKSILSRRFSLKFCMDSFASTFQL
jgi:hypothetical protein